jgi:hypothetical protein
MGAARFALDGITALSPMSENYLHIRASGGDFALRIEEGREVLFQLPGVSQ